MGNDLTHFTWQVCKSGYRWLTARDPSSPSSSSDSLYLSTGIPLRQSVLALRYHPLSEEPGLFRTFAETDQTEEGIQAFANHYGLLGGKVSVPIYAGGGNSEFHGLFTGEAIGKWQVEIHNLGELTTLWDLVRANSAGLSEFIKWDGASGVRFEGRPVLGTAESSCGWIAASHSSPEALAQYSPGDLVSPALHYLQKKVNENLSRHHVSASLLWDSKQSQLNIHIVPDSLVGCLWLQFARAIDGNRDYRRCPECRKWFEATSHVTRADRVFCSPSCKASAHRKKIAEAKELDTRGTSVEGIAQRLNTDVNTVKRWVGK